MKAQPWTWGVDSPCWLKPRRTLFFIYRRLPNGDTEYLNDKRGRLRTWATQKEVEAQLHLVLKHTHVGWSAYTVHRFINGKTACGLDVPSPAKVGPVGYYAGYDETHLHFCRNCKKKGGCDV
jgi:hypothetical protein